MEEMKEKADSSATPADATEGEGGKKRFALPALPKRTLILIGVGVAVLALAVAGGVIYGARMQQAKAAAVVAAQQKREAEARAAAAQAEMLRLGEEARRSHQEILEHSVRAPVATDKAEADKQAEPEDSAKAAKENAEPDKAPASSSATQKAEAEQKSPAPAKFPAEAAVPNASGGCTLSGKSAEDYGKALGRCLEEYNRLEGRPPRR